MMMEHRNNNNDNGINNSSQTNPPLSNLTQADLNLSLIGNCTYGALIDSRACIHWCCLPRFDADPVFCSLLRRSTDLGFYDISIEGCTATEQSYLPNTAVLQTRFYSKSGIVEITDFAPRFHMYGRTYRPTMLIRVVKAISGHPRIKVRVRPTFGYGWGAPEKTRGTNHIRYLLPNLTMRLTTNAPVSYIVDEVLFEVTETLNFLFMPDESLKESITELVANYLDKTIEYWHEHVRHLSIPFEYQEEVIRSCITLKLCSFEETGAMVASLTTSIPVDKNSPGYDLRFCWLRDSSTIIKTLNKLGTTKTMEDYLKYITNIVAGSQKQEGLLQPVYGIALETRLYEKEMHRLAGYRGMGPVRVGTRDYKLVQNDVYGQVILAITQMFFDKRLQHPGDRFLFERLEDIGEKAIHLYNQPDAGPLGVTNEKGHIHTYSSVMCWVACDRLGKIAMHLKLSDRASFWTDHAKRIHSDILENCWNKDLNSITDVWGGDDVDTFLLFLPEVGFIKHQDPMFLGTLNHVEKVLRSGNFMLQMSPKKRGVFAAEHKNISTTATLWYINALASVGRKSEAKPLFENLLKMCPTGLLSEEMDPETGELWGNFPKTTSMVGLVECALKLSVEWEEMI